MSTNVCMFRRNVEVAVHPSPEVIQQYVLDRLPDTDVSRPTSLYQRKGRRPSPRAILSPERRTRRQRHEAKQTGAYLSGP